MKKQWVIRQKGKGMYANFEKVKKKKLTALKQRIADLESNYHALFEVIASQSKAIAAINKRQSNAAYALGDFEPEEPNESE